MLESNKHTERIQTLEGIIQAIEFTINQWTTILTSLLDGTYQPPSPEEDTFGEMAGRKPHTIEEARSILSQYTEALHRAQAELAPLLQ
jgi:hypothetical protein